MMNIAPLSFTSIVTDCQSSSRIEQQKSASNWSTQTSDAGGGEAKATVSHQGFVVVWLGKCSA